MSLYGCIRKNKYFDKADYDEIKAISERYEADGLSKMESNLQAIDDLIEDELNDYRDLHAEVSAKGGVLAFTPQEFKEQYLPDPVIATDTKPVEVSEPPVDEIQKGTLANTEDAGAELIANRRQKGLTLDDIKNAENDAQKMAFATKAKLWERPDYQVLVDSGVQAPIAHVIKQIYDSIPNKPSRKDDKYIYAYAEGIEVLRNAVNDFLYDNKAQGEILSEIVRKAEQRRSGSFSILDQFGRGEGLRPDEILLDKVFPKDANGNRVGRNNEAGNTRALALGNLYKNLAIDDRKLMKAMKAVDDGWPTKKAAWQRSYTIEPRDKAVSIMSAKSRGEADRGETDWTIRYFVRIGWRTMERFYTQAEADKHVEQMPQWYLLHNKRGLVETFDSQEKALEAVLDLTKRDTKDTFKEPEVPVEKSIREGRELRDGKNVSTQDIIDAGGFKGINFGNWMKGDSNARERQAHVNSIYDAVHDLAEVLGVPVKAISLNGMLGIAVGAQGKGGKGAAAAHFIPGINEINITRGSGAGSLAHEFGHALDHYFGVQAGISKNTDPFLSTVRYLRKESEVRPEIFEHFKTIYQAMTKIEKGYTKDEIEAFRESALKSDTKRLERSLDYIKPEKSSSKYTRLVNKLKKGQMGDAVKLGKSIHYVGENVNALREEHKKITGRYFPLDNARSINLSASGVARYSDSKTYFENHPKTQTVKSEYYKKAIGKESVSGKPYWSTSWEMFARSFEIYVLEKLQEKSQRNDYLTSAWKTETEGLFGEEALTRYPQGMEREKINAAFDALIDEIKTRETDQGTAMYDLRPDRDNVLGVDRAIVEIQTEEFLNNLKLNEKIDVRIYDQWQDLTRDIRVDPEEARRAHGFIQSNTLYIIAGNLQTSAEIAPLLRHEILAHYGLDSIDSADKLKILRKIVASRDIPFVKQYWDEVSKTYGKKYKNRSLKIAEEVFARIAELDPAQPPKVWERIVDMVIKALRKVGLYLNTMTRTEARELLKSIAKGITGKPKSSEIRAMVAWHGLRPDQQNNNRPFYSELTRQVEDLKQSKADKLQWQGIIRKLSQKGVKQEEIDWSGVEQWLAEQKGSIPKDAVVDYLRSQEVVVEEVTKGATGEWVVYADLDFPSYEDWLKTEITDDARGELDEAANRRVYALDKRTSKTREEQIFATEAEARKYAQEMDVEITGESVFPLRATDSTKFADYQIPGGQNYRELVLTLPDRTERVSDPNAPGSALVQRDLEKEAGTFTGGHYEEPNVLAHVRFNERTVDGKKTLFIEEVQSDWHQKGRKEGYGGDKIIFEVLDDNNDLVGQFDIKEEALSRLKEIGDGRVAEILVGRGTVPEAPFKKSWPMLVMKRMIRYAAENGFDQVAWTTGEQQVDRYDLSKQVDVIVITKNPNDTYDLHVEVDGETFLGAGGQDLTIREIETHIGKDLAAKALKQKTKNMVEYKGEDLRVGGEGLKGFYDKILPTTMNKYLKKWRVKVGEIGIVVPAKQTEQTESAHLYAAEDFQKNGYSRADALKGLKEAYPSASDETLNKAIDSVYPVQVHAFPITEEMRESAMGGLPMFNLRPDEDPVTASAKRKAGLVRETFKEKVERSVNNLFDEIRFHRQEYIDSQRQGYLDRFHGIALAQKRIHGNIPTEQSPYVAARLSTGISSVMRGILLHGMPRWNAKKMHLEMIPGTKGFLPMLKPVADNIDDFFGWMIGNRAARLMKESRERNFTNEEIAALQALGKDNEVLFRQVAKEFAEFKRAILDVSEQAGIVDSESRRVWDNADWIPFYRQTIDDRVMGPASSRKSLAGQSSRIRQLKGGRNPLNDPMENIIMNFRTLLEASLRNNAILKAREFMPGMFEKVTYTFKKEGIPQSEVKRKLRESGMSEEIIAILPRSLFKGISNMWAIKPPTEPDVIRVMVKGKPKYLRVTDPLLLRAVTSFEPFDFPGLGTARLFKRILTAGVTAWPGFGLRNFIRDTANTFIVARNPTAASGAFKGIVRAYRESGSAIHRIFAGASFASGYIEGTDPEATARAIRRALRQEGFNATARDNFIGSLVDSMAKFWDIYRRGMDAAENANRDAVFESTFKETGSITAGAFESKDLMDFSLRGDFPIYQVFADVLAFFNSRVQGMYRLGRTNPKQLWIRGALLLTIPSLLLSFAHLDDDEYKALPDWDKDLYWHFWMFGEHFRIPKPFEVGVIFATIPERAFTAIFGDETGKKFLQRLGWNIAEQLNLVEMPQIIRPAVEVIINYDTFTGRPIENMGDERKSPRLRYDSRTSTTMRELSLLMGPVADEIGLSPKKAQHLIEGYLGTMGVMGLAMADMGTRMAAGDPARPTLRPDDIPILKILYRGPSGMPYYSTQYINDIYEGAREYSRIITDYKTLMKEGKEKEAMIIMERNYDKLSVLGPMSGAAKAVSAWNHEIDRIVMDKKKTPLEKRKEIDKVLGKKNLAAKEGIEDSKAEATKLKEAKKAASAR